MFQTVDSCRSTRFALSALIAVLSAQVLVGQGGLQSLKKAEPYKPSCTAENVTCDAWAQFRTNHPYPYQSIQWKRLPDRRIAIMLLEPPPVLSKSELEKLIRSAFGINLQSYDRYRWQIGIDGWLEDTVFTVSSSSESAGSDPIHDSVFRDRIAFLYVALFGTTYGATFDMQSDGLFAGPSNAAPNLIIQPGEVRRWMNDAATRWEPLGDTPRDAVSWQIIRTRHMTGAFVTTDRTLVMLTVPSEMLKRASKDAQVMDPLRVPFRCFALATDSIVGAFQANGHVAVLGRARTQSLATVPPLRFETFKLLATQTSDELSQSYERRSLFAGKLRSGKYILRDWAPIYLSDSLVDTEFGVLLDTTDQLLKSWSEAGHVEYLNFNYPKPLSFPFQTSLSDKVEHDSGNLSVLYNWNTAGSAVMMNTVSGTAWTTRQTGALPVTYGAGAQEVETAKLQVDEETAYKYFAKLKDANLNRVVQYSFLYQLFRSISGGAEKRSISTVQSIIPLEQQRAVRARHEAAAIRVKATMKLLSDIQEGKVRLTPEDEKAFTSKLQRFRAQNPGFANDKQLAALLSDRFSDEAKSFAALRRAKFEIAEAELQREVKVYNDDVRRRDSKLFDQNVLTSSDLITRKTAILTKKQELEKLERDNPITDLQNTLRTIARMRPEMDDVRQGFIASYAYEAEGSIKTPTVVISWDPSDIDSVGGHNINARTLRIEPSESVRGIILEDTESGPVLRYNPSKASLVEAHATELSRAVEHRGVSDPAELERIIAPPVPFRARSVALELPKVKAEENPPDVWSASLGNRLFTEKSQFVDGLGLLAEKSECCEFVGYDDNGFAFATEKNLKPPPATVTYELRDTPSLAAHVERAAKRGRPLIFLDTPEGHVEALTLQTSVESGRGENLEALATWLGSQRSGVLEARVDGIADTDLHGDVSFFKTIANKSGAAARALLERFTLREPTTSWVEAQVRHLDRDEITGFVNEIGWDAQKDGTPTAVMVSFSKGPINRPPIDVSVVAGFGNTDFEAGRNAMNVIQQKNWALAKEKGESLARYALTVRNEIKRMPQARVKRLLIVIRDGKTKQLLSMREWSDGLVSYVAEQAG